MMNNEMPKPERKLSPLKSIKFYCKNLCCAGDMMSWKNCTAERCVLWKYRLGKTKLHKIENPIENSTISSINSEKNGIGKVS